MRLLLATRNAHKVEEFHELLPSIDFIPWPSDAPEIPESGAFFQDNALQKATYARDWWKAQGLPPVDGFLADDSGICVDALWGGPGVLSARFANHLSQDAKNRLLLSMLPEGSARSARFVCVLALAPTAGAPFTVGGAVEGTLAFEPRGTDGFGYDPIFIPEGHDQTFGELGSNIKHALSHRGRAAGDLKKRLGQNPTQ
ncbi:non-canonical purine NTP pyrophosphatase [Holophaga foetida]|uniref:non-canonical purine NTP pyrophosphatase n=1 Tax=Holophaga foetida TaxID=35839 RepID=UPI0002472AC3|nr:non-canonical purine NTP pyrophosphatase [Holophaga foetida]